MYDRILLPTDAEAGTELATEHAIAVAEHTGAELHLLYVVDSDVYDSYSGDEYVHEFEGLEAALEQIGEDALGTAAEAAVRRDSSRRRLSGAVDRTRRFSPTPTRRTSTCSSWDPRNGPASTGSSSGASPTASPGSPPGR